MAFSHSCPSVPFLLRTPDAGLGRHAGFLLCVGPGLEVRVRKDVQAIIDRLGGVETLLEGREEFHEAVLRMNRSGRRSRVRLCIC